MNGDNLNPCEIVNFTDWDNFENVDGFTFSGTLAKLRDLTSGDFSAIASSLYYLNNTLLNDGVVYPATVPAFRYVAALLGDRPSRAALAPPWEGGKFPLRGKLLAWLANVAFYVSVGQEQRIREWGRFSPTEPFPDFIAIRSIYPEAFSGVACHLDDSDSRVVEEAVVVAVRFLESPALAMHRKRLTPLVENVLARSSNKWYRSLASQALDAWGQGRMLIESYADPLPSEECERVRDSQENWGSADEPPF
ncbi:hypothetical protein ACFU8W_38750 [Streptomyces sp. NPDC057565]|uniref:hypothetical protein n=1 Tax=Streptomyces sp. NPDC057565 TaxID=3346169 RepID=UPI0036C6FB6C